MAAAEAKKKAAEEASKEEAKQEEEAPAEAEKPVDEEKEQDAVVDKRAKIADDAVCFTDFAFGAVSSGSSFKVLGEAACIWTGAKLSVGVKKGRYLVEFRVFDYYEKARVGVSAVSEHGYGEPSDSMCLFDLLGPDVYNGSKIEKRPNKPTFQQKALKTDVIGLFINMDPKSENKNTISLFLNGVRASDPVALPETSNSWYPTVCLKGGAATVNTSGEPWKPLVFRTNNLAVAAKADVEVHKEDVRDNNGPEAIFVVAADPQSEAVLKEFEDSREYFVVSMKGMIDKAIKAGTSTKNKQGKSGWDLVDFPASIVPLLASTTSYSGKYVFALNSGLKQEDRKNFMNIFCPSTNVKAMVFPSTFDIGGSIGPDVIATPAANLSLPTEAEGFASVEYASGTEKTSEKKFEAFKKRVGLRECLRDLKPGPFFKEFTEEYATVKKQMHKTTAPKKGDKAKDPSKDELSPDNKGEEEEDEEEAKVYPVMEGFSEEDWMLAQLRVEMHALLHSFLNDSDAERLGFTPPNLPFYYMLYASRPFNLQSYGLHTPEKLADLIPDVVRFEDGMLMPQLPLGSTAEDLIMLTEQARVVRKDKYDAGDDTAALKFQAFAPKAAGARPMGGAAPMNMMNMQAQGGNMNMQGKMPMQGKGNMNMNMNMNNMKGQQNNFGKNQNFGKMNQGNGETEHGWSKLQQQATKLRILSKALRAREDMLVWFHRYRRRVGKWKD
ncbi:unnamed protein product [Amoebophrya sp. A120]|nr:unnamed protein product [Amoebophrya sp. A120]|eukprot:GSA120T00005722001.1